MSHIHAENDELALNAPARIHFGLFSVTGNQRFGGMGLMVCEPATVVCASRHKRLEITGLHTGLTRKLAEQLFSPVTQLSGEFQSLESLPLKIAIERAAPRHAGFGTGTQIAFAIATAVFHALDLPLPDVETMTRLMERGRRSAIGSYGFFQGGCLVDNGKTAAEPAAALELRLDYPPSWPVVLIRPRLKQGLNGHFESAAFESLNCGDHCSRDRLIRLCHESLVPALRREDYDAFAEPLYEFNRISGEYFSGFQHGVYHGPICAQIVEDVRRFGVLAVGQSSWGPCIFALAGNDDQARELISHLRSRCSAVGDHSKTEIIVTRANNSGMALARPSPANMSVKSRR